MTQRRIAQLTTAVTLLMVGGTATQAHAFLRDNSNQKVIMIGKGGAESMQREVRTVSTQPEQTTIYNQSALVNHSTTTVSSSQRHISNSEPAYTYNSQSNYSSYETPIYSSAATPTYSATYGELDSSFDRLALSPSSAAVLVYDVQTGQPIYEKNVDARRSIASITKVMTAMVVLDAAQDMREELTISSSDLVGAKQASTRLKAGDRLSRSEFMLMMLMKSENPAAKTLASHYPGGFNAFVSAMNQKAQSLGMHQTRFSDSSGLDPRNVSSANDLAKMMREVASNPRYQTIRNFSTARSYDFYINNYNLGSRTYSAANTSSLVRSGGYPIGASKTGFIREAGYCVVMETHVNGRPAIVVLLGANASQTRWKDAEAIMTSLAYRY